MKNTLFSAEELAEIRAKLEDSITELRQGSEISVGEMKDLINDSYSDPSDRATLESDRNRDLRIQERGVKLISKIQKAIVRIDGGTYQVCDLCGEGISKERMLARPVTDLCIKCKEAQEQVEWRGRKTG